MAVCLAANSSSSCGTSGNAQTLGPTSLWSKCVFDPAERVPVHADDIESAGACRELRVPREESLRCQHQLALFMSIHRDRRAAEAIVGAIPDLDKHEAVIVHGDNIDFAQSAAVVGVDNLQAMSLEETLRLFFTSPA